MKKAILIGFALLALAPCPVRGADVIVQAESYTGSYNVMPENIRVYNSIVLVGIDYADEWAEFQVVPPAFGTYNLWMRCWGTQNVPYLFHLVTRPVQGEEPETRTLSFVGRGSCGS
jgi:hypothetical protein